MKVRNSTNRPAAIGKVTLEPDEEVEVNPAEFVKEMINPDQYLKETVHRLGFTIVESAIVAEPEKKIELKKEPPMSEETKKKKGGKI